MIDIDLSKGTFVRPVWTEQTGQLEGIFSQLNFSTKGAKHNEKRRIVFGPIVRAASIDPDHQVYWITNRSKHQSENYPVSLKVMTTVVEAMQMAGWISLVPNQLAKDGYARRWTVSSELIASIPDGLLWFDTMPERPRLAKHQLIKINHRTLKKYHLQAGYRLPAKRHTTEQLEAIQSELEELNTLAMTHSFDGLFSNKGEPRTFRGFYRTFAHDLFGAGRTYGGCEQMSESKRLNIMIDGEPVSEVDITSCQPTILFSRSRSNLQMQALEESPSGEDYYQNVVNGLNNLLTREQVKAIVTKALGNANFPRDRWPHGMKVKGVKWQSVANIFLEQMPFLDLLEPVKEDTFTLQHTEADILFRTLYGLYKYKNIAALPVHDSLVVPAIHAETTAAALRSTFWYKTGVVPRIKVKTAQS